MSVAVAFVALAICFYSRIHRFLFLESVSQTVRKRVMLFVRITTPFVFLSLSYHQDTQGIPSYNETIECSNVIYRALHSELCANCWVVPINTTSVMYSLSPPFSERRNRCIPVVNSTTETTARCIVPESPEDPSDPGYIDPNSRECLAQSVETKQTKTQASNQDVITNALLNFQVFVGRTASDVQASYLVIALGAILSFFLGFFFLVGGTARGLA